MTEAQAALLRAVDQRLAADPRILSLWLTGSFGRGEGDAWSDIDLIAVVEDIHRIAILDDIDAWSKAQAGAVFSQRIYGRVLNVITAAWVRFDVHAATPEELTRMPAADLKPVFTKHEAKPESSPTPHVFHLAANVNEFIRVLGLGEVALGREEYLLVVEGLGIMRRLLIDLMLEENGVTQADRGGALKINRFLTREQRESLEGMPPWAATRESAIAANKALAALYLPRAKSFAAARGLIWPQDFENAARAALARAGCVLDP